MLGRVQQTVGGHDAVQARAAHPVIRDPVLVAYIEELGAGS